MFLVTTKSSDADYYVTDMLFLRESYNENFVRSSMGIAGIFSDCNMDADEFATTAGQYHVKSRRQIAVEIERDGEKFYRYNIVTSINHGLARQEKPLPSGSELDRRWGIIILNLYGPWLYNSAQEFQFS